MKSFARDFVRRGFIACGLGPVVLAVFYLLLQYKGAVEVLSVNQVCIGIFSLSALAFIAGGMNAVYKIEKLPLMAAILIHGSVLYVCYLVTYLLNDWLETGILPILVFSAIFISGFLVIWLIIYSVVKRKTEQLNKMLEQKQYTER
ncbi:MAG: DUF3021 domain-containing protein [Clostridia bacterium]|nr:DUF3021 domain-containing protein [Clostridia bacterium]